MYERDLSLLVCPLTQSPLVLAGETVRDADGEILEGELHSSAGARYSISNGIPRFCEKTGYNPTWDFKWTEIDRGRGLNYRQIAPGHRENIFSLNDHGGAAWRGLDGALVLDLGCGVGRFSVKALRDHGAARVVSVDLTRGVDMFRKIVLERFPELKPRLLMVQASALLLPFRPETFDYAFSLGVLHHTGSTIEAIRNLCRMAKPGGQINLWIYAPRIVHLEDREPGHLYEVRRLSSPRRVAKVVQEALFKVWLALFRHLSVPQSYRISRLFASDAWYRFCRLPGLGVVGRIVFPVPLDPDHDWRLLNIFDGYVNTYAETWNEHEIFPVLKDCGIAVKGISAWRTGFWGTKVPDFYAEPAAKSR
jgi:SAM-dependent methyltransferase